VTTGLSYNGTVAGTNSYVEQLANLAVVKLNLADPTDPFTILIPQAITYAENRIYRDLDFLSTVSVNSNYSVSVANRNINVPASAFVTIQEVNLILPANTTIPDNGTRQPLLPTTKEYLNNVYPSPAGLAPPSYFAMIDQNKMIVGPWPDNTYTVEIVGTIRPDSLSSTNTTTFISLYLPDLLLMASMIFVSGYQRNFGRQSDDPAMAQSYESQYKTLMTGATMEEMRKKFQSSAWSSMSLPVVATPTR